jgi:hypothetical protein
LSKNWMNVLLIVLRKIMKVLSFGKTCVQARSPNYDVQEPQKNRTTGNNYGREWSKIHGQGRDKSRCVPCRHHGDRRGVAVLVVVAAAMSLVAVAKDCIDDSRSNVSQLSVSVAATAALWVAGEGACCIQRGSVRKVDAVMTPWGQRNEERDYESTDPI